MSSYHFTCKVGKKGKAKDHASYISREGKYMGREVYEDLVFKEAGNMPAWAEHNQQIFWNAADEFERDNGTTYREYEFALPNELNTEQQIALVKDFVKKEIGEKHAYQYAIHSKKSAIEGVDQAHCHLMFSERTRDGHERDPEHYFKRANGKNPEKGGCKKANTASTPTERKQELIALRGRFAELQNQHLKKHGHDSVVDHRSYKERGIDMRPEPHFGPVAIKGMVAAETAEIIQRRRTERDRASALSQSTDLSIDFAQQIADAKQARITEKLAAFEARTTTTKGEDHANNRRDPQHALRAAGNNLRTAATNIDGIEKDHRSTESAARFIAHRRNSITVVAALQRCIRDQKQHEKVKTLDMATIDAKLASFEAKLKAQEAQKVEMQKQNEMKIAAEKEEKRKEYAAELMEKVKPAMEKRQTEFEKMLEKQQAEAERRAALQKNAPKQEKKRDNDNDNSYDLSR